MSLPDDHNIDEELAELVKYANAELQILSEHIAQNEVKKEIQFLYEELVDLEKKARSKTLEIPVPNCSGNVNLERYKPQHPTEDYIWIEYFAFYGWHWHADTPVVDRENYRKIVFIIRRYPQFKE